MSNKAVIAFIDAYIGGKNDNGSTLGNLTVNNIATTTGIKIETKIISLLYLIGFGIIFTLIALIYLL
tara:strand:+ start:270 stop:470 length:201 start_codon:yes stop_codon:yes gene_type:complete